MPPAVKGPHYGQSYRNILKWVRATFPVKRGYKFRVADQVIDLDGEEVWAMIRYNETSPYEIVLRKHLTEGQWIETLLHEVSHALDTDRNGPPSRDTHEASHRNSWGKIYSEVYRKFHKWQSV